MIMQWKAGDAFEFKDNIYIVYETDDINNINIFHISGKYPPLTWMLCFMEDEDVYYVSPEQLAQRMFEL